MTKTKRYGVIGLVTIVVAILIAVVDSRFGVNPSQFGSQLMGRETPDVELVLLGSDETISLRDVADANEVTVVNFFASWCIQCRFEHPDLLATSEIYADRGVQFIGISFQEPESASIAFLDELGWGEEFIYVRDPGSIAAIEFGVFGLPETFFIRDGQIIGRQIGQTTALRLSEALESILAGNQIGAEVVGDQTQQPGQ